MFRISDLSDRAHAEANVAALRGHASDAAEVLGPRVNQARDLAEPYVQTARERIEPYVTTARERVEPYVATARDRIAPVAGQAYATSKDIAETKLKPAYEQVVATSRDTVAPAVVAAVANAATSSAPARREAQLRGLAALAALRGEPVAKRHRRWPLAAGMFLLGALIGAAAVEAARRVGTGGPAVAPTPLRPNTVVIPDTIGATKAEEDSED